MGKDIIFNTAYYTPERVKYDIKDMLKSKNNDIFIPNHNIHQKIDNFNIHSYINNTTNYVNKLDQIYNHDISYHVNDDVNDDINDHIRGDMNDDANDVNDDMNDDVNDVNDSEIYQNNDIYNYEINEEHVEIDKYEDKYEDKHEDGEIYIDEEIYNPKINIEDEKYKNISEEVYIEKIFAHLNIDKIIQLCGRNKIFNNICNNNIVWIYLLKRDFEITYKEENAKKKYMTYREYEILRHKAYVISKMPAKIRRKKSQEIIYKYFGIKINLFTGYKILFEKIIKLLNKKFIFILDILSTYHLDGIANVLSYHATYIKLSYDT